MIETLFGDIGRKSSIPSITVREDLQKEPQCYLRDDENFRWSEYLRARGSGSDFGYGNINGNGSGWWGAAIGCLDDRNRYEYEITLKCFSDFEDIEMWEGYE
jgi:hypothetical protein